MNAPAGRLLLVVGPSGAGKDSIIRYAQERLHDDQGIVFPRRAITRIADRVAEDHASLTDAEFDALASEEGFAFTWQAHGLKYGVPLSAVESLGRGKAVVVNVSRTIIIDVAARYPLTVIAEITAAPDIRAARIAARGRETLGQARARSNRDVPIPAVAIPSYRIVNDGVLAEAGEAFCRLLQRLKQ